MSSNLLIHIPHTSLYLPKEFYDNLIVDKNFIEEENIFVSDYLIDIFVPDNFENIVKVEVSRLCCDVERFLDDSLEEMSKLGMGVIYEKDSNGNQFINVTPHYKKEIIKKYYLPHHKKLNEMSSKILNSHNICNIIDLHSFSDDFVFKVLGKKNSPDICIGTDKLFTNKDYKELIINHFLKWNYTVLENYPYKGTIIPNDFINKNNKVNSIMIEINKRIYLDKNKELNLKKVKKLKKCMNELYEKIDKMGD